MSRSLLAVGFVAAGMTVTPAWAQLSRVLVFGAESNRLNAYDGRSGPPATKQTVIPSASDDPQNGRDINAQICFFRDGSRRFVSGEDTGQPDPPPGWGIFQLAGDQIGALSAAQIGKLTPTYQASPDNYGCGILSDGRIVTSDIGDIFPGMDGNGQLIVWFPPFDSFTVRYCKIDLDIATAGGIYVDDQDRVYVASNRPDNTPPVVTTGGIYRYSPPFPTSDTAGGGCGQVDGTGAPLADTYQSGVGATNKAVFIASDTHALTPSAVIRTLAGTFYVSSVFNGVIAEYDANGVFIRRIVEPPAGEAPPFPSTGTPFGMGLDADGTLYYADLGIGGAQPIPGEGSEFRVRFAGGNPQAPQKLDDGLTFPDGIGILEIPTGDLHLTRARIRAQAGPGAGNGSIRLQGDFTTPPAFSVPPAFAVRVEDNANLDRSITFTNCRTRNGRVRCSQITTAGLFKASLKPLRTGAGFRFRVRCQRQAIDGPFAPPVAMTLTHHGGVLRTDTIANCRQTGPALSCRE